MEGSCDAFLAWYAPGESRDDEYLDRISLIAARATSAELESSIYLLWLAQETLEKNTRRLASLTQSKAL